MLHYCERLVSHDEALHAAGTARVQTYRLLAHGTEPVAVAMPGGELAGRVGSDVDELADVLVRAVLPIAVAAVLSVAAVGVMVVNDPPDRVISPKDPLNCSIQSPGCAQLTM